MDLEKLERIRDEIQNFTAVHQEQIFLMLERAKADYQETSRGILVNLGYLSDQILDEIIAFTKYVKEQEATIKRDEEAKEELRENYFGASA